MIRNFSTYEDIYVVIDGKSVDVHNELLFRNFHYDAFLQEASIKCDGLRSGAGITFKFSGVHTIKLKEADSAYPRKEARYIGFVGFLRPDDIGTMDGFLPDDGSSDLDFIIGLQDGSAIKVGAREAVAVSH